MKTTIEVVFKKNEICQLMKSLTDALSENRDAYVIKLTTNYDNVRITHDEPNYYGTQEWQDELKSYETKCKERGKQ